VSELWEQAADQLRQVSHGLDPTIALVLGSGLGSLVDAVQDPVAVSYEHLPGFPQPTVQGHAGRLILGHLSDVPVAVMQGRTHYYESGRSGGMETPIRTLQTLGCETLILTNAAGSLQPDAGPGSLMLIEDHISLAVHGPLVGTRDPRRFVDLVDAYDPGLREQLSHAAATCGIDLKRGVYMWFSGPNFETPAEIRAARVMGADAVGMSTVPEVIVARMLGLRVAALSVITNLAAGMASTSLSHRQTIHEADRAGSELTRLILKLLEREANDR
jgi:purine-nucleoside phosphorylase